MWKNWNLSNLANENRSHARGEQQRIARQILGATALRYRGVLFSGLSIVTEPQKSVFDTKVPSF